MARRAVVQPPPRKYPYASIEECEEAPATKGLHLAEVKTWPPLRSRVGEANPHVNTLCARCGGHLILYGDNDPEVTGIEVKVLGAKAPVEEVAKK